MITSPDAMRELFHLYRGRPYSKSVPFAFAFSGVAGETATLYVPNQAIYEFAGGVIKTDVAAAEFNLCDNIAANPFTFVIATNAAYTPIQIGQLATYRSNGPLGAKILLVDPTGVAQNVKGALFIFEVTADGYYR